MDDPTRLNDQQKPLAPASGTSVGTPMPAVGPTQQPTQNPLPQPIQSVSSFGSAQGQQPSQPAEQPLQNQPISPQQNVSPTSFSRPISSGDIAGAPVQPMPPVQVPVGAPNVVTAPTIPEVIVQTPSRHIPDLTSPQQIMTSYSPPAPKPTIPSVPSGQIPPAATPPKKPQIKAKGFGLPKPFLILISGFAILFVLFLFVKLLASIFGNTAPGKVTLTYWGLWEDANVMQAVLSDFERQNPTISVNYIKEDPHEYSKSILTRIQNGTGPDIFRYHVSWLPMMLPSLLPLSTDAVTKSDFTKAYYPVVQQDLIKNGAIYGIPLGIDTLALYINKKMFDDTKAQVPTTWDAFITTARSLTKKDANGKIQVAGAALGTYDNITHAPDLLSLLLVQNGVTLSTMTPASNASDALTFYTSFANDQSNVWDNTLDPSILAFERGKLAMYIGYSYDIFAIKAASPDMDFAIYPVPHLPGRDTTIASYWVEGVSSKTAHPKEAMKLMHFLSQKDTAAKLYTAEAKIRLFGEPYARVDLADTLKNNPLVYPFVSQATNASSSFFAGETQDTGINASMNQYIGNAVNSILKDTSAESAVDTLTKGVSQVLNQYGQQ